MNEQFQLPRQKISQELIRFLPEIIKRNRLRIRPASKTQMLSIAEVSRRILSEGLPSRFALKKLPKKLGFGIFLKLDAKPIARGEVIAPYTGEVLLCSQNEEGQSDYIFALAADLTLTKLEQQVLDPKHKYHPRRLYAIDVDAEKMGNFTRFINHSDEPNVEADLLRVPKNDLGLEPSFFEMIYFAKKTIHPGEQLLVCYEGDDNSYWGASGIEPFPMHPSTFRLDEL